MITTVTGKNQVTVPAALVSKANIRPGTKLDWELGENKDMLLVKVLPDPATVATRLRGCGRKYKSHDNSAVQNLVEERGREDTEKD